MPRTPKSTKQQSTAGTVFEASPSFLICALGNRIDVSAERHLRKALNISLMEWRVLEVLAVEPAAPPGRIISVSGVHKAAVSRAVNALEQRGLLTRAPAPDHGLRTNLFLTAAGRALYRRGIGERQRAEEDLLTGLTEKDRKHLIKTLQGLMRNYDNGSFAAKARRRPA
jgi:DNA-binding MarR family transcriptional regulator